MNRKPFRPIKVTAQGDTASIYLYGDVGFEVSAEDFVKELESLTAPTITLHINSSGGDLFGGKSMAQAVKSHPSKIICEVDGLAASAASYIAIACDEVRIAPSAFFMVHKPATWVSGNADDLLEMAATLDKIEQSMIEDYAAKTGKTSQEIATWLAAETWFSAEESVAVGLADSIIGSTPEASPETPEIEPDRQFEARANASKAYHAARLKLAAIR